MRNLSTSLIAIAFLLAGPSCDHQRNPELCCSELPAGELPGTSIYQLSSKWQDQNGASRELTDFRGGPVVVAMIFTTCEYACPMTLADLKKIEAGALRDGSPTRFLLLSFDSKTDLPARLKDYAATNNLDEKRWTLLRGEAGDVRELAAVLGVKYKRSEAVGFSHSNLITLLDQEGRVAHQQRGINSDPTALLTSLSSLTKPQ